MKDFVPADPNEIRTTMAPTSPFSDDQLVRYLLGGLPPDEADVLDERSVIDDEMAERLRVVEDELLDAYAAGTLAGERLRQFESFYLASPRRRNKAAFAKALRGAIKPSPSQPSESSNSPAQARQREFARWGWWPLATAAGLIVALGALGIQNATLRRELRDAEQAVTVANQRSTTARQQLDAQQQRAAAAEPGSTEARSDAPFGSVALVLPPQTRGVTVVPRVTIRSGTTAVRLDLALERTGGTSYNIALRDPATNRSVWRSPPVAARRVQQTPIVSVAVPASLLKAQHYAVDLYEIGSATAPEFVNSYAFEVVRQ